MSEKALVGIVMGSQSDWETMKNATETLKKLGRDRVAGHAITVHADERGAHPGPLRVASSREQVVRLEKHGERV